MQPNEHYACLVTGEMHTMKGADPLNNESAPSFYCVLNKGYSLSLFTSIQTFNLLPRSGRNTLDVFVEENRLQSTEQTCGYPIYSKGHRCLYKKQQAHASHQQ